MIHKGCPILAREEWPMWLGEGEATAADQLLDMMRPVFDRVDDAYPVDRRVGNVRNYDVGRLDEIPVAA